MKIKKQNNKATTVNQSAADNANQNSKAILRAPALQLKKEKKVSLEESKKTSSFQGASFIDTATPPASGNTNSTTPFNFSSGTVAPIQRKNNSSSNPAPFNTRSISTASKKNLPQDVRGKMENAFKADFSAVNIHSNSSAASAAGALAFAQGDNVHFAPGQYNPQSSKGQELIGHELTHVIQQRQGRVKPTIQAKGFSVNDNSALEREADVMGRKAANNKVSALNPGLQKKAIASPSSIAQFKFADDTKEIKPKSAKYGSIDSINLPVFDPKTMASEIPAMNDSAAGDPRLVQAMTALYNRDISEENLEKALKTISELRGGVNTGKLRNDYNRAMQAKAQGEAYAYAHSDEKKEGKSFEEYLNNGKGGVSPDLDLKEHPNFTGSVSQLRYGQIMGDAFGIDPIFGSLMNPTGGIVGPGNDSLMDSDTDPNHPVVQHGVVHDAAGYLKNAHGISSHGGYNYLQNPIENFLLGPSSPLSGQLSGIDYWTSNSQGLGGGLWNMGTAGLRGTSQAARGIIGGGIKAGKGLLNGVKSAGKGLWGGAKDIAKGNVWKGIKGMGGGLWDGAKSAVGGIGSGLWSAGKGIFNGAKTYVGDTAKGLFKVGRSLAGGALDVGKGLWNGAKSAGKGLWGGAKDIAKGNVWKGIKGMGGGLWNGLKDVGSGIKIGAKNVFGGIWDTGKSLVKTIGKKAGGWLGGKAKSAWGGIKKAGGWLGGKAKSAWGGIKKAGGWLGGKAKSAWGGIKKAGGWLGGKAKSAWGGAKKAGSKLKKKFLSWF